MCLLNWHVTPRVRAVLFLMLSVTTAARAQTVKITSLLNPDAALRKNSAQLVVTVESSTPLTGASLLVTAPTGFVLASNGGLIGRDTSSGPSIAIPLGAFTGRISRSVQLSVAKDDIQKAQYRVLLDVLMATASGQPSNILAHESAAINVVPEIARSEYLVFGLIGIAVGYIIRLLVKTLSSITPPPTRLPGQGNDPPAAPAEPGPITRFVTDHYYQVDFAVTIALGAAALIALIKDGHPPESASAWYSALILGLGLGALTNSELITKQRPA